MPSPPATPADVAEPSEPRWMRSRWADWTMPSLISWLIPSAFAGLVTLAGVVSTYRSVVHDEVVQAVSSTLISVGGAALTGYYIWLMQKRWSREADELDRLEDPERDD